MGGGEGAKERRRLQRLGVHDKPSKNPEEAESGHQMHNKSFNRQPASAKSSRSQQAQPKSTNKKVKKPKHLKRKLEMVSDMQSREMVLKKIADFEETKARLAGGKRQKILIKDRSEELVPFQNPTSIPETDRSKISAALPVAKEKSPKMDALADHKTTEDKLESHHGDSDDLDSDDEQKKLQKRERGRRRRGRKDTAKEIQNKVQDSEPRPKPDQVVAEGEKPLEENSPSTQRYCIGRKPVTDFVIGEKYPGKVVYVKQFGVFFDIGCHSDAFCHVSRLSDDFVENPQELFKEGEEFLTRVVEIDRKRKRITVSLQSDQRLADEKASVAAREERKRARKKSRPTQRRKEEKKEDRTIPVAQTDLSAQESTVTFSSPTNKHDSASSGLTPAEEKRSRKLARRAARREQATSGAEEGK